MFMILYSIFSLLFLLYYYCYDYFYPFTNIFIFILFKVSVHILEMMREKRFTLYLCVLRILMATLLQYLFILAIYYLLFVMCYLLFLSIISPSSVGFFCSFFIGLLFLGLGSYFFWFLFSLIGSAGAIGNR